ncbi:hypothetical protein [Methylophaga sp.]|uniref:hypothetical protein n=1 Tax=Methylophaga sp. TaxID=2024840 RepID=UPI003A8F3648
MPLDIKIPSHICNLAMLFKHQPTRMIQPGYKMFRGCWLAQNTFPGGNWFAPTLDGAAQYVAFHAKSGREKNYTPYIFEGSVNHALDFVDLNQSHIDAFSLAYSGIWSHEQIIKDIPLAFASLSKTNWAGFFCTPSQEYFVCNPTSNLTQQKTWANQQALAEASRVKGFNV